MNCFLCGNNIGNSREDHIRGLYQVDCKACGRYAISINLTPNPTLNSSDKIALCWYSRLNHEKGNTPVTINHNNYQQLAQQATDQSPKDIFGQIDLLVQLVKDRSGQNYEPAKFVPSTDFPMLFAVSADAATRIQQVAINELKYLRKETDKLVLTVEGWKRLDELRRSPKQSNFAFVAMWFDESMDASWGQGFSPALQEVGLEPFRVDRHQHNGKIDDEIIAKIKESKLLVADFTEHRGGVYFEAGFAKGLGIPVIWTCREDHFDKLHFDTRQFNHIKWSTPVDLKKQLIDRIKATILP